MYVFLKVETCEPWNLCVVSTRKLVGLNIWPQWWCQNNSTLWSILQLYLFNQVTKMSFWSHVASNPGRKFNFKLCWINDLQLTLPQIPWLTFCCCQSVQYFTLLHLTFLEIFNLWLTVGPNEARTKLVSCTTVKCINYHWKLIFKCC